MPGSRSRAAAAPGARATLATQVALLSLVAAGCGGGSVEVASTADARGASAPRGPAPVTDADPPPYAPPPQASGETGGPVSLRSSGGEDQARRMMAALLLAIRDADEAALHRLLADEIAAASAARGMGPGQPRLVVVQRILVHARRGVLAREVSVEQLVDLDALEVRLAEQVFPAGALPPLLRPTDLVVEVPIQESAFGPLRTVLDWHRRGVLVVRPGRDTRIVAL